MCNLIYLLILVCMEIISLNNTPKVPFNIDGRILFSSEKYELVHLQLAPNESIAPHTNPFDVVFYMLEGTSRLFLNGEEGELKSGDCIYIPGGLQRGLSNQGDKPVLLLVNKLLG